MPGQEGSVQKGGGSPCWGMVGGSLWGGWGWPTTMTHARLHKVVPSSSRSALQNSALGMILTSFASQWPNLTGFFSSHTTLWILTNVSCNKQTQGTNTFPVREHASTIKFPVVLPWPKRPYTPGRCRIGATDLWTQRKTVEEERESETIHGGKEQQEATKFWTRDFSESHFGHQDAQRQSSTYVFVFLRLVSTAQDGSF